MKRNLLIIALVSLLCLAGCAPANTNARADVTETTDTPYREEKIPLPDDAYAVLDMRSTERGVLLAVSSLGRSHVSVLAQADGGAWEELFNTDNLVASLGGEGPMAACLTPQGQLLCSVTLADGSSAGYYVVDDASFTKSSLPLDSDVSRLRMSDDDTVFATGSYSNGFSSYDFASGEKRQVFSLDKNDFYSDFVLHEGLVYVVVSSNTSSQTAYSFIAFDVNTGERANIDPSLQSALNATLPATAELGAFDPLCIASASDGLYVCSQNGVYRCTSDGAQRLMVEKGTHLENGNQNPRRFLVLPDGGFIIHYEDHLSGSFISSVYRYVEGERAETTSTLTVYTLEDNAAIQQAVALFRDERPDVAIELQVGIPANSGLSVDDAVRSLNADLLAGAGPDVMVLDGLPMQQMIDEGMLLDLQDELSAATASASFFEKVLTTFADDAGCFALPTRFVIPAIVGDATILDHANSLEEFTTYFNADDESRAALEITPSVSALYLADYPNLMEPDGSINEGELASFFDHTKQLFDIGGRNLSDGSDPTYDSIGSAAERLGFAGVGDGLGGSSFMLLDDNNQRVETAMLLETQDFGDVEVTTENASFDCVFKLLSFSDAQVFQPRTIVGVSVESGNADVAKEFVSYLLSKDQQGQSMGVGLPVRESSFEDGLRRMAGYSVSFMGEGGSSTTFKMDAFTDEEVASFITMLNSASVACVYDKVLTDALAEELELYCKGEITLDEAVATAMQKINLYQAQ